MNAMDTAGYIDSAGMIHDHLHVINRLDASAGSGVDLFLRLTDAEHLESLRRGGYYDYRLTRLGRPAFDHEPSEADVRTLDTRLQQMTPAGEFPEVRAMWNDVIELRNYPLFLGVTATGLEATAKLMVLLSQLASLVREDLGGGEVTVEIDTEPDLRTPSPDQARLFAALQPVLASMPSALSREAVRRELAEQGGQRVFGLPLERRANPNLLRRIADTTGGEAFRPRRVADVAGVLDHIARDIRHTYTIGYIPADTVRDGRMRRIRVIMRAPAYRALSIRTRQGYVLNER
jgi:hypothetical protein